MIDFRLFIISVGLYLSQFIDIYLSIYLSILFGVTDVGCLQDRIFKEDRQRWVLSFHCYVDLMNRYAPIFYLDTTKRWSKVAVEMLEEEIGDRINFYDHVITVLLSSIVKEQNV